MRPESWEDAAGSNQRVGDSERARAADSLRDHFTAGRLDVDEFSARLDEVWRAATTGDLAATLRDLPAPAGPPAWSPAPLRDARGSLVARSARVHLRWFLTWSAFLVAIWALTGFGYFWPAWPLLFFGYFVTRHLMAARRRSPHRGRPEPAPR